MSPRLLPVPVLLALMALPAWGQSAEEVYCSNRSGRLPAEQVMAACNSLAANTRQTDTWRAKAHAWRGIAHNRVGDRTAALADFNRALELDDDNFEALYGRAQLRYNAKEYAAALDDLNRAQRLRPDFGALYILRSNVHLSLHRYAEAIADADFRRGGGAAFLTMRCRARAVAGVEFNQARTACDQALWIDPDALPALNNRGLLSLKQGRFDAAWKDFNAVVQAAPRNARALYGRGLAAIALKREAEGKADLAVAAAITTDIAALYAEDGVKP